MFPQSTDESLTNKDEDSLAETLLHRLNIPIRPLVHDELQKEEGEVMVITPKKEEGDSGESGEEKKAEAVGVE